MTFPIEQDIPQPKFPRKRLKYPWDEMKVSQSFFVPEESTRVRQAVYARNKATGEVWKSRRVMKNGIVGQRVWRIS